MSDSVAKRSQASAAMVASAAKGRALMGGSDAMRQAGETYLPKFPSESLEAYRARKDSSWLFNGYRKTVRDMTGRVFDKPVELGEEAPAAVKRWVENIDMEGRDLSTFARQVFEDAMAGPGISFIMVDAPQRDGDVTRAQAEAGGMRPYFVHLRVEDILGWKTATVNNATVLSQVRIMEEIKEPDPDDEFAEIATEQVRVLDRSEGGVQTRIYRKVKSKWLEVPEMASTSQLSEITIIPFYANRAGFFTGAPLLDDLSDVNIAHWQSQSDQRNILHFARVPILFAAGMTTEEGPLVISSGAATTATDANAKLEWVEHTGKAIDAGRQDLKDLEFQMETHGLQLLVVKGQQSATGEALDAAKETSTLSMTADQLKDALEQAMDWLGKYGGQTFEPSVTVNKDFGVHMMGAQELTAMLTAVNTGNMSRETFLREMARRGMIRSDIDVEDEIERIEAEGNVMEDAE
ncbi:hypothetical protein BV394_02005 [Brevirhabdus pacifica]|uniref:Uncharacterized protein n=1 Tax=Brevirhabdus pacifica TaxID=1267768 RepID=A0A1U7DFD3_9RHOB|nr:DUF4055 domain-containing protein [Brevirhabdus pacifica]APX88655.1 hypothetical protein BV394_02005 [Brevirhabdus pacifica]PJJ86842.1 uncharacterized protein DUF4055 [Brevirhabdus pacifica]